MNEQLLKLYVAMQDLLVEWEAANDIETEKLNMNYPFHLSFDEICAEVAEWLDTYNQSEVHDAIKKGEN